MEFCEAKAREVGFEIEGDNIETEEVSFDVARYIAKEMPLPVVAVMLCDDMAEPMMHFVR